jgi:hypothetical protein
MFVFMAGCLLTIALCIAVLRGRTELVIGIAAGLTLAGVAAATVPTFSAHTFPIWLPVLPFACVALTLFVFGALAWWWGTDR